MRTIRTTCFLAAIGIAASLAPGVPAQNVLQGTAAVQLKLVATAGSGAAAPDFGAHSGDPRFLYLGQQSGLIRILDFNQSSPLLATNFLNVGSVLGSSFTSVASGERGLLGGAFHPDFNSSDPLAPGYRKFYTYTSETIASGTPNFFHQSETGFTYDHQSVIREWTLRPVELSSDATRWREDGDGVSYDIQGLADHCLALLNAQVFADDPTGSATPTTPRRRD